MRRSMVIAATLAGAALLGARDTTARVGAKPEYKFEHSIDNGYGVKSLESLHGKPTLFEFWATY
jgi:hypothetical protein